MLRTTALTWSYLDCLTKKRAEALTQAFSNLDEALKVIGPDLLRAIGSRQDTIIEIMNRFEKFNPEQYECAVAERGLTLISIEDDTYPSRLRQIPDPPMFLYYIGDLSILDQPSIALVGTRNMSPYGQRVVEHLVPPIVRSGCVTVSGLALGIDTVVAKETLRAGGRHVAVLGNGLGKILPQSNATLADAIIAKGGLILSEFPLDKPPGIYTFPSRNRIIAALSLGTVVCEAPEKSGALITAELALEYGRDVFMVPGNIFDAHFAGSHRFLGRGQAKLITCAEDVLQEIGITKGDCPQRGQSPSPYQPENSIEKALYDLLTTMPQPADDLVERSGIAPSDALSTLTMLELAGAAKSTSAGWIRQ